MSTSHRHEVRVYYEDTDFSGAVYHAAYLHFFERGRTEFLRAEGVHHSELAKEGVAFAVRSMEIEFLRAAGIDDLLVVDTAVSGLTGVRLTLDQSIERGDELIARAKVVVVAVKAGRAVRLPRAVIAALGR
ncbi:MAG: tol-pal system-associated acyl-CoA thioesterase [Devosia sp.]|jgi:acyl-CoA thioester hydrolase